VARDTDRGVGVGAGDVCGDCRATGGGGGSGAVGCVCSGGRTSWQSPSVGH